MAAAFGQANDGPLIVAEIVRRGLVQVSEYFPSEVEDLMKPRLQLVQHMACNSRVFSETPIMTHLITLWDTSDQYHFGRLRNTTIADLKRLHKKQQMDHTLTSLGGALMRGFSRRDNLGSPEHTRSASLRRCESDKFLLSLKFFIFLLCSMLNSNTLKRPVQVLRWIELDLCV